MTTYLLKQCDELLFIDSTSRQLASLCHSQKSPFNLSRPCWTHQRNACHCNASDAIETVSLGLTSLSGSRV